MFWVVKGILVHFLSLVNLLLKIFGKRKHTIAIEFMYDYKFVLLF